MARSCSGSVFESPAGSGRWHGKFTTPVKRFSVRLVTCTTREQADARKTFIAGEVARLVDAGRAEFIDKLLKLAAQATDEKLERVRRGVNLIVAGDFERPLEEHAIPDAGPTFQEFAERWTSGELHRLYPDHVAKKESVADDIYRLKAHVFPLAGSVRIREFRATHAELVMASLPEMAAGTRRQVAQLVSRVLKLAVYPARIIERSPIPSGFLPRPGAMRAQAWLYPEEEARLLGCTKVPLLFRFFYGFLAREGLRSGEAKALQWSDLDLQRGVITIDENKTDDPRAWALDISVTRALVRWKERLAPHAKPEERVFTLNGEMLDVNHLAATFREHLNAAGGMRPVLFERAANRMRIRIHDQRATFITLALANGRTETWVADRTGHKSSQMINRYRRAARTAAELNLGWLKPFDESIPELAQSVYEPSRGSPSGSEPTPRMRRKPAEPRVSTPLATGHSDLGSGAARRGGSSPSSCTRWESEEIPAGDGAAAQESATGVDDSADTSTRGRLVSALTEALRRMIGEGDREGADVALRALGELARINRRPDGTESRSDAGASVTRLSRVRGRSSDRGGPGS